MTFTIPKSNFFSFVIVLFYAHVLIAQPRIENVAIQVTMDRPDWTYKLSEKVKFQVSVIQYGNLLTGAGVRYEIKPEKMGVVMSGRVRPKN